MGGKVDSDHGSTIVATGNVWNTSPSPDISLSTRTVDGNGIGSFISDITGLLPKTTYYVRAYATNAFGTEYGSESHFGTPAANVLTVSTSIIVEDHNNYAGGRDARAPWRTELWMKHAGSLIRPPVGEDGVGEHTPVEKFPGAFHVNLSQRRVGAHVANPNPVRGRHDIRPGNRHVENQHPRGKICRDQFIHCWRLARIPFRGAGLFHGLHGEGLRREGIGRPLGVAMALDETADHARDHDAEHEHRDERLHQSERGLRAARPPPAHRSSTFV